MTERQSRHKAVMDLNRDEWLNALRMDAADIPKAVIMEGSWWRAQRTEWRLSYLDDVRELAFPDMFYGLWLGSPVVYSCVYGAPRAVRIGRSQGHNTAPLCPVPTYPIVWPAARGSTMSPFPSLYEPGLAE